MSNQPDQEQQFDVTAQAQNVVDNLMGEQSSMFKNIISTIGVDDKEFWKGAMIGAAAALLISNESVRKGLLNLFGSASESLKSAGSKAKNAATSSAETAKEGVTASTEIFKDTIKAGKAGFKKSVAEHKQAKEPIAIVAKTSKKTATAKKADKKEPNKRVAAPKVAAKVTIQPATEPKSKAATKKTVTRTRKAKVAPATLTASDVTTNE